LNERRQRAIRGWQQKLLVLREVVGVAIPILALLAEVINVHERHADLHQPPRDQQILAPHLARVPALRAPGAGCRLDPVDTVSFAHFRRLLAQIERPTNLLGIQQPQRLVIVLRQVRFGTWIRRGDRLQPVEKLRTTLDAGGGQVVPQHQFLNGVTLLVGVDRDSERVERRSEESAALARGVDDIVENERQSRVRHDQVSLPLQMADRRAMARKKLFDRSELLAITLRGLPAGMRFNRCRIVQAVGMMHAANQGAVVHHLGHSWQMLADSQTGHRSGDRLELAADGTGRLRLQIVGVQMTWATIKKDKYATADRPPRSHRLLVGLKLRLPESTQGQSARRPPRQQAPPIQFAHNG